MGNWVSITDFAEARGLDRNTINTWIRRHPEVENECEIQGRDRCIHTNSPAYKILEEQYPLPKPVQVLRKEDMPDYYRAIDEAKEAYKVISLLQEQLKEQAVQIAEQKSVQLLLEDRTAQLNEQKELFKATQQAHEQSMLQADERTKEAREKADQERIRAEEAERKLAEMEQKAAEAEEKAARMENAGFWARLRKKW